MNNASPILLLQTYSHYLSILCFHTPSLSHLRMLNDAETYGEYPDDNLSRAPRIK